MTLVLQSFVNWSGWQKSTGAQSLKWRDLVLMTQTFWHSNSYTPSCVIGTAQWGMAICSNKVNRNIFPIFFRNSHIRWHEFAKFNGVNQIRAQQYFILLAQLQTSLVPSQKNHSLMSCWFLARNQWKKPLGEFVIQTSNDTMQWTVGVQIGIHHVIKLDMVVS